MLMPQKVELALFKTASYQGISLTKCRMSLIISIKTDHVFNFEPFISQTDVYCGTYSSPFVKVDVAILQRSDRICYVSSRIVKQKVQGT